MTYQEILKTVFNILMDSPFYFTTAKEKRFELAKEIAQEIFLKLRKMEGKMITEQTIYREMVLGIARSNPNSAKRLALLESKKAISKKAKLRMMLRETDDYIEEHEKDMAKDIENLKNEVETAKTREGILRAVVNFLKKVINKVKNISVKKEDSTEVKSNIMKRMYGSIISFVKDKVINRLIQAVSKMKGGIKQFLMKVLEALKSLATRSYEALRETLNVKNMLAIIMITIAVVLIRYVVKGVIAAAKVFIRGLYRWVKAGLPVIFLKIKDFFKWVIGRSGADTEGEEETELTFGEAPAMLII